MGAITFSIPKDLVTDIVKQLRFDNFVETGTFEGGSSFWAAKHFDKVYTIEIDPAQSKKTASKPDCPKNIDFLVGNSKDVLPVLVKDKLKGRSFFWLDGHWCGGGGKDEECPLMEEFDAIRDLKDAVIFVDDARCFLGPPPEPHNPAHWPRIDEIFQRLHDYFPGNFTTIQDDVIMSVPPDVAPIINADWKAKFDARYNSPQPAGEPRNQRFKKIFFNK